MNQLPVQGVIHELFRGIARMEVPDDDSSAGGKDAVRIGERLLDKLVVEIVDQSDAVHKLLRRQVHLHPAKDQGDQVLVAEYDLPVQPALGPEFVDVSQGLNVDVEQRDLETALVLQRGECIDTALCTRSHAHDGLEWPYSALVRKSYSPSLD